MLRINKFDSSLFLRLFHVEKLIVLTDIECIYTTLKLIEKLLMSTYISFFKKVNILEHA